jgi:hypothetical protein
MDSVSTGRGLYSVAQTRCTFGRHFAGRWRGVVWVSGSGEVGLCARRNQIWLVTAELYVRSCFK